MDLQPGVAGGQPRICSRLIDAILVGTETVLVDNPRLTARGTRTAGIAQPAAPGRHGTAGCPADAAVRGDDGRFHPPPHPRSCRSSAMLFADGVRHVMVEGGSRILSAFLAAGLVDELIVYLAPTLLGSGTPALTDLGISTLADAQHWDWDDAGGGAVRTGPRPAASFEVRPSTETNRLGRIPYQHHEPFPGKEASETTRRTLMFTGIVAEQGTVAVQSSTTAKPAPRCA